MKSWLVAISVGGWLVLGPSPAGAYVRAVADSGAPLAWKSPCVTMDFYVGDVPGKMTADAYVAAAGLAAHAWSHAALSCTALTISMRTQEAPATETGADGRNVIIFRQDNWCDEATPESCYPHNALAVTSVLKNKVTGEIVDADMELNAVSFTWADLVAHPELADGMTADFQNTLTHELGHVIGLAHPCYSASDGGGRLNDNTGVPELDCTDPYLPASVLETTMFPSVQLDDVERRTLSSDDARAACEVYPGTASACAASSSASGCAMTPTPADPGLVAIVATLAVLVLAGLAGRRRCRRRARLSARSGQARPVARRYARSQRPCRVPYAAYWVKGQAPCRSRVRSSRCVR